MQLLSVGTDCTDVLQHLYSLGGAAMLKTTTHAANICVAPIFGQETHPGKVGNEKAPEHHQRKPQEASPGALSASNMTTVDGAMRFKGDRRRVDLLGPLPWD